MIRNFSVFLVVLFTNSFPLKAQVNVSGAMKNVMRKGQLYGTIHLDTIQHKQHLYGLGPIEYLAGELLVVDGKAFNSIVLPNGEMKVIENFDVKAPFFVYTNVENWKETSLPESVRTIQEIEAYVDKVSKNAVRPFAFKLHGTVESAEIHIVNLPKGSVVSSPQEAHRGQKNYQLENTQVEIIGFFSTEHQAIFTHHDTYLHMHLLTADKTKMGHLDAVTLLPGSFKLYLPEQ